MFKKTIATIVIVVIVLIGLGVWFYSSHVPTPSVQTTTAGTQATNSQSGSQVSPNVSRTTPSATSKKSSPTNTTATGAQGSSTTGWSSQSVVVSQSPLVCYTIQYPPQLTPQYLDYYSPPREYFADEVANHKSIANGLNGVEITPIANTTAETVYKRSMLYTLGTSKITDFSTIGGLTGKEFLTPPINGLEPQGMWAIYLDLSEAGNNFALIISTPGTNTYDKTTGEAIARSIQPSCANH